MYYLFFIILLLSGCGGGGSTPISHNDSDSNQGVLVVDNAGVFPLTGVTTSGGIHIHNLGGNTVSGVEYSIENGSDVSLLNAQECSNFQPSAACYLRFSVMTTAKQGSFAIVAHYTIANKRYSSTRVINYLRKNPSTQGVSFSSDVSPDISHNAEQYSTFYIYNDSNDTYSIKQINTESGIKLMSGGTLNDTLRANDVTSLEVKSDLLSLSGGVLSVNAVSNESKSSTISAKLGSASQAFVAPLSISLVPILDLNINQNSFFYVYNSGAQAIKLTSLVAGDLISIINGENTCNSNMSLEPGGVCRVDFKVSTNHTLVQGDSNISIYYEDYNHNPRQDSVAINWYNSAQTTKIPFVKISPSHIIIKSGVATAESILISNSGTADLFDIRMTPINFSQLQGVTINDVVTDCKTTLKAGADCHYSFLLNSQPQLSNQLKFRLSSKYFDSNSKSQNYILNSQIIYDSTVESSVNEQLIRNYLDREINEFKNNPVIPDLALKQQISQETISQWQELVQKLVDKSIPFYYGDLVDSECNPKVNSSKCNQLFINDFYYPLQKMQNLLYALDADNINIFKDSKWQTPFGNILRAMVVYGDNLRANMRYPIDSQNGNQLADAIYLDQDLYFSRERIVAPGSMGAATFGVEYESDIPTTETSFTVNPGLHKWWIQDIGLALPGVPVTIQRVDHESIGLSLRFTSEIYDFNDASPAKSWTSYFQPFNLGYHSIINLPIDGQITYITPYPMSIVLEASNISKSIKFKVKVKNLSAVSSVISIHDAREWPGGRDDYFKRRYNEIEAAHLPWVSILLDDFHIEEPLAYLRDNIKNYSDSSAYFDSLMDVFMSGNEWMMGYSQASGDVLPQDEKVLAFCTIHNLDCTSSVFHSDNTIRIENDNYYPSKNPHGGGGWEVYMSSCTTSGPYDWCINHEVGHTIVEQQYGGYHLMFPNTTFTDSANNILPSHAEELYFINHYPDGFTLSHADDVDAFSILKHGLNSGTGVDWSNTLTLGERLTFYHQLVILNSENKDSLGWRIYPLFFKISRLFDSSAKDVALWESNKNNLGFGSYTNVEAQNISPEDFSVIAISWITGKDYVDYFKMWGLNPSDKAAAQVHSFGFTPQKLVLNKKYFTVLSDTCVLDIKTDDWNKCDYTPANQLNGATY